MQTLKRVISGLLAVCVAASLSGCGSTPDVTADEMNELEALTFEEIAAGNTDSADMRASTVYQYVTDTVTIDTDNLVDATAEADEINKAVQKINEALYTGDSTYVDASILNYMLWEFATTPYKWAYTSTDIKGVDAATRLYFVDIKYKTTNTTKELIPDSLIVRGSPDEEALKAKRYSDYITWLDSQDADELMESPWGKLVSSEWRTADALSVFAYGLQYDSVLNGYTADADGNQKNLDKDTIDSQYGDVYVDAEGNIVDAATYTFEDRWGSIDDIFATQNGVTMVDRLRDLRKNTTTDVDVDADADTDTVESEDTATEGADIDIMGTPTVVKTVSTDDIGVYTYPGLTEVATDYGAEMTFRVVLQYKYSIGTDNAMCVQSVYLYDYSLNDYDSLLNTYTTETVQNGDVLTPFIKTALKAYRRAVEESNHNGLYNLFVTYDKYDTYIADLLEYCYVSNGGFNVELIGRKGDEVAAIVTQRTKKRAKGTDMSMPTYQEQVLVKVKLCTDDKIRIVSLTTLSSTLIGEPLSVIRNVTGVSEKIAYDSTAFSTANAVAVEEAIAGLVESELNYKAPDLRAEDYDIVDLGMSTTEKTSMLNSFGVTEKLGADKAVVWLTSYATKSNVYCSVNIRTVYFGAGENMDTEATVGLINRNGAWRVMSYKRTMQVKTAVQSVEQMSDKSLAIVSRTQIEYVNKTDLADTKISDTDISLSDKNNEASWDDAETSTSATVEDSDMYAQDIKTSMEKENDNMNEKPKLPGLFD